MAENHSAVDVGVEMCGKDAAGAEAGLLVLTLCTCTCTCILQLHMGNKCDLEEGEVIVVVEAETEHSPTSAV